MDSREVFLAHHGILGQRWGRKNGPPYPLDASDHSASEKKAGWRRSLAGGKAAVAKITKSAVTKHKERVEAKKRQQEELKKQQEEEERERIIKNGDPNEILANRDKFSDAELRRAKERVREVQQLQELSSQQADQAIKNITNKAKTIKDAVDTGIGCYESYKKLNGLVNKNDPAMTQSQKLADQALNEYGQNKISADELNRRLGDIMVVRDTELMKNDASRDKRFSRPASQDTKQETKPETKSETKQDTKTDTPSETKHDTKPHYNRKRIGQRS